MLTTAQEIAQYFKKSVFVDFDAASITSYAQIQRQQDEFFSLIDRDAFSALLNDCLYEDNQLVDIFMDVFDAEVGIQNFAKPNARQAPIQTILFFLNTPKYQYHKNDIAKVYLVFNSWLAFFGAKTISPEWEKCPFCGNRVNSGVCTNANCKKTTSECINAALQLAKMFADETSGKETLTPPYWDAIKNGSEFYIEYKNKIDAHRLERNKGALLEAEAKKKKALSAATEEINRFYARLDLEAENEHPNFESVIQELNKNATIQEAFKFNDPGFSKKIDELKASIAEKKEKHQKNIAKELKKKEFLEAINQFLEYQVMLEQEFSATVKSLPRIKELYDDTNKKYSQIVAYVKNGGKLDNADISAAVAKYEKKLSKDVSEYITTAEHEQRLMEKQEKLSVSVNLIINQFNSIRAGEGKAKEIEDRFNAEIECNKIFNDYRVERRSQYNELVNPIRAKISELVKLENDLKIKDFKQQTNKLLKEIEDAKPRNEKSPVLIRRYEEIKNSKYYSSISNSSEFANKMNDIKSKIDVLAKEEAAFKLQDARRLAAVTRRKKIRKKVVAIMLATILIGSGLTFLLEWSGCLPFEIVLDPVSSKFSGKLDEGNLAITGLKKKERIVEIPSTVRVAWQTKTSTVNKIDSDAFKDSNVLEVVELPQTIETIGSGAFANCANLHRITLNSTEPPQIFVDSFQDSSTVFYVPEKSYDKYIQDVDWSEYSHRIFPNVVDDIKHIVLLFDENGGSDVDDIISHPIKTSCKEVPTTERYGFDFVGWYYYSASGDETPFYANSTVLTESVKLVAKWALCESVVTFDYSGGKGTVKSKNVKYQNALGELPSAERAGYSFDGWYLNGTRVSINTEVDWVDDTKLTAQWKANTYTVTFDYNGGQASKKEMKVTYDSKYGTLPVAEKPGFNFEGWYIGNERITSDAIADIAQNHTLTAKWGPIKYKVLYNLNGGEMDGATEIDCTFGVSFVLPEPKRAGYVFSGWEYNETKYNSGQRVSDLTNQNNSAITLNATWTANINKLLFNANGGSGSMSAIEFATDDVIMLPKCTFTKENYVFSGWAYTSNGEVEFADKEIYIFGPEPEVILYAIWIPAESKIVFNANGGFGSMTAMTCEIGTAIRLPECTFTRNGYIFVGWSLSSDSTDPEYDANMIFKIQPVTECVLYAIWTKVN